MAKEVALTLHGTKPASLSPMAIVQTAQADLRRHRRNEKRKAEKRELKKEGRSTGGIDRDERLAFLFCDVSGSKDEWEVIERALAGAEKFREAIATCETINSQLPREKQRRCPYSAETIEIYMNAGTLREALQLAPASAKAIG